MGFLTEARRFLRQQMQSGGGVTVEVLAAAKVLDGKSAHWQRLDPDGAPRDVMLPDGGGGIPDSVGLPFHIRNDASGAFALVVKNPAGATIVSIVQNQAAVVVGTGDEGWTSMGATTVS